MSDILIKGIEMPTRCGRCDMRIPVYDDGIFDHYECCITAAIIDNLGEKMEDCPVVPVPPHGRLIDADALEDNNITYYAIPVLANVTDAAIREAELVIRLKDLDAAPTIIPADPPVMYYPQVPGITPTVISEEGE